MAEEKSPKEPTKIIKKKEKEVKPKEKKSAAGKSKKKKVVASESEGSFAAQVIEKEDKDLEPASEDATSVR